MSTNTKFREVGSGVFINMDKEGLTQYKEKKKQDSKVDEITSDINSLKSELSEIKEALKILIEKN